MLDVLNIFLKCFVMWLFVICWGFEDAPTIQSASINGLSNTPFNDSDVIRITAVIRAYPAPTAVTWGIKNDRFTNPFKPLTSKCLSLAHV